ncbi:MAG: Hsp20/alpha crystallin family protein [Candidatus Rokubacteria bacterium]|nr:Hsp20/alpha crystallin family protein [Candidatus Rokubacteria bacterium]
MAKRNGKDRPPEGGAETGLGGILRGLGSLVEKLGELAETGREFSKTGELREPGSGKGIRGIYGFTVKVGIGGEGVKVEPFGNIRRDEESGRSVVQEVREPAVDVFEERDHTLVVAEMPGIGAEDVRLEVKDDLLTVAAEKGDKKYKKEVLLPGSFPREKMQVSCANGVLEIRCVK